MERTTRHDTDRPEAEDTVRVDVPTGLVITRVYDPDREAMLAALRVVLGLPPRLRRRSEECTP